MTKEQILFGLMPVLDATLELPRTVLPLKSVRYHFVVRGGMAEVEMTQVYCQENSQPLDCEYLFPLPADGAVYRCEAIINGRLISARIEEREAARKIVEKMKAEGRRTVLVESERDNLFTLSLGNIQPQDVVEVKLGYLQPLRRLAGHVTFDLPLCPGVRYIPGNPLLRSNRGSGVVGDTNQVPDASRITPPRIDAEHPDAAFIELDGVVEAGFIDGEINSPSHKLTTARTGDILHLTLAQGGEAPDRDLAFRWREKDTIQPVLRCWTCHDQGNDYALLELRAPAHVEPTDAVAQDVYFLVDRSGSMRGEKWEKAIQALHGCVEVLNPNDRVSLTLFETGFNDFDAEPASPATLMADPRFRNLASVGTAGGTEMEPALRHVLGQVEKFSKDRPAVLILITDAEIGNEREIIALMSQHPSLPVHCFGIDTTLNDSLLLDLVRQQGGTFLGLQPQEDVAAVVTRLGRTLRQPVLVNLQLPNGWELAAGIIPNLYAGHIHLVSLRSKGVNGAKSLKVSARDHRNVAVSLEFDLTPVPEGGPRLRWCKERLVTLVAKAEISAAIRLSKEANLLCALTAFVAWDAVEKVAVANHRLVQPAMTTKVKYSQPSRGAFYAYAPASAMPRGLKNTFGQFFRQSESTPPTHDAVLLSESPAQPAHRPPEDLSGDEKRVPLQRRIRDFMLALRRATGSSDCVNPLIELRDWVQQAADLELIDLIAQLLDACERDLPELTRCEQRLHKLAVMLADEFEQAASKLRKSLSKQPDQAPSPRRIHEALSRISLGSVQQEAADIIDTMLRLQAEICKRVEDFLRQHANPTAPTPTQGQKKGNQ